MTLQELRYFLAVADLGSFTLAAEKSGVSQPSLSEQIRQLERGLKTRLFDRLHRKVILTAAGRTLLAHARQIVTLSDSMRELVHKQSKSVEGPLSLAATPTLAPFIIANAIAKFTQLHPRVDVALLEASAKQIVEQIKSGDGDVGVIALAIQDPQILVEPLFSESLVVAIRKRHRLSAQSALTFADLAGETLIAIDELRELAGLAYSLPSTRPNARSITGTGLQLATIESLVAAGVGVCLLPAMARITHSHAGVIYRPIQGRAPVRTVSAIWHRDRVRPLAAQRFMETLRSVTSTLL